MLDNFGRDIHYLRLSVTDLCNLRCKYCMPSTGIKQLRHEDILSVEEIESIVKASAKCGIRKVRITGGEPLVRRGIMDICERMSNVEGIEEVCMTTNGVLLKKYAKDLKKAGVDRLNISLDTLNPDKYAEITRGGDLNDVLDGMKYAEEAGFTNLKINIVLVGNYNDDEINNFVELTRYKNVQIRFIELMPIGQCKSWSKDTFISAETVLTKVKDLKAVNTEGVATIYKLDGAKGSVGLIRPMSSHFCPTCNRIRVTADGKLKACLHSDVEVMLKGLEEEKLETVIREAILQKPQKFSLSKECPSESGRYMNQIGG